MNLFTPNTRRYLRRGIEVFAWLLWLSCAIVLITSPSLSAILLIVFAVVILGGTALSVEILTVLHHQQLGTKGGVAILIGGIAITFALQSINITSVNGILIFLEISLFFSYPTALIALMIKRDVSVTLVGTLLLLMTWAMALAVVYNRGLSNVIFSYLSAMENNGWWWWNALSNAFWCALPVSIAGFVWHLGKLGWKEWKRN